VKKFEERILQTYVGFGYDKSDLSKMELAISNGDPEWVFKNTKNDYTKYYPIAMSYDEAQEWVIDSARTAGADCILCGIQTGIRKLNYTTSFFSFDNGFHFRLARQLDPEQEKFLIENSTSAYPDTMRTLRLGKLHTMGSTVQGETRRTFIIQSK
jgi:hypothetical protein